MAKEYFDWKDEPDDVDFNSLFDDLLTDMLQRNPITKRSAVSNGIDFETALVISEGNFEEEAD
jgi:hypothetical protein